MFIYLDSSAIEALSRWSRGEDRVAQKGKKINGQKIRKC